MQNIIKMAIILAAAVLLSTMTVAANESKYKNTNSGLISDINLEAKSVEVEVPIANGRLLTVGGPLVKNAEIRKDGRKAELEDFRVGEWVQVSWEKTEQTLLIKELANVNP